MSSTNARLSPPGPDVPGFDRLCTILRQLRSPEGCPWDREQTPESLRSALIEEVYETVDAVNKGDLGHVCEELGDAYLMITMIAEIYEERGDFSIEDVLQGVNEKLIRRHPHVFSTAAADNPDAVAMQWEEIKEKVEGRTRDSVLDAVSHALPPLERAYRLQKKAAKAGFDWNTAEPVWDKIAEELAETREAWAARAETAVRASTAAPQSEAAAREREHLEEELGDLLFSVVNVARFLKIDPAVAMQRSNAKFDRRFRYVEKNMKVRGSEMCQDSFDEMDALWEEAKRLEE
ncbi:nucleoside triphosphate pyrophosphohydrolase [Spirochaeta dissipatitropha]